MRFKIFNGDQLIGWSNLESGDPPMGFANGVFHPNEHYGKIQPTFRAHFGHTEIPDWVWSEIEALGLRAEAPDGTTISDHVHFCDATGESEDLPIEVEVHCHSAEVYEQFFLHHIEAYDSSFGSPPARG